MRSNELSDRQPNVPGIFDRVHDVYKNKMVPIPVFATPASLWN